MWQRLVALAAPALSWILNLPRNGVAWCRERPRQVAVLILIIVVLICVLAWAYADSERAHLWFRLFTGNWSPPVNYDKVTRLEFAITTPLAIIINWAPLIAAFVLVYRYLRLAILGEAVQERKKSMRLKQAFDAREVATKFALRKLFAQHPELEEEIDAAFVKGEEVAKEHLIAAFGVEETEEYLNSLDKEIAEIDSGRSL